MKQVNYTKGIKIESDTKYVFDGKRIDFYMEDTVFSTNAEYRSMTTAAADYQNIAFLLKDLHDVTIDFGGATLVFHGRIVPFTLDNCKNLTLSNFKIDYDRPFYSQAHVLSVSQTEMDIKMDEGFDYYVKDGFLFVNGENWEKKLNTNDCLLWLYDRNLQKDYPIILALFGPTIFPNENPPLPIRQILVEEKNGGVLHLKGEFPKEWENNDGNNSLIFTHEVRDKPAFNVFGCENLYLNNVIIIHCTAMALSCMRSKNIYVDNFSMYNNYENNGRLATCNADAVHAWNCSGDFTVKNCHMEGMLDDTFNIHNNFFTVKDCKDNLLTICSLAHGLTEHLQFFSVGQEIAIYRGKTQELRGIFKILDIENKGNLNYLFTLDKNCCVENGDTVENLTAQPDVTIENCDFGVFRGTMRMQSRGKTVIRNCTFNNKEVSIFFTGDTDYWYESSPVRDVLIENCKFYHSDYKVRMWWLSSIDFTPKANYYHKNITIKNCYFDAGDVADFSHVDGFTFKDNTSNGPLRITYSESANVNIDGAEVVIK